MKQAQLDKTVSAILQQPQRVQRFCTKDWPQVWGPPPGKNGCLLPKELISTQLTIALSERRIAA